MIFIFALPFSYFPALQWMRLRQILCSVYTISEELQALLTVLESPGKPVTGSPSILKGYHNSLTDGSPSTCYKSSKMPKYIDGVLVTGIPGVSKTD